MTKIRGVHENEIVVVVFDPSAGDPTGARVDDDAPICVLIKDDDWDEATENTLGEDWREGEPIADIIDQRNRFRVACWALVDAIKALPIDPRDIGIPIDAFEDLMKVHHEGSIGIRKPPPESLVSEEELTAFLEARRAANE